MSRKKFGAGGFAILAIAGVLALATIHPTPTARGEPSAVTGLRGRDAEATRQQINWRVIDGDTFEDLDTGARYRLENIDTPETGGRARCTAERQLGNRATEQARLLIANARELNIRSTGRIDRYDRIIAFVQIDGRDLGELMIEEGLARPWRGRREPWCDAGGNLIP